jgi:hypothetical protein
VNLNPWKSQVIPTASLFKLPKMWSCLQMWVDATAKGLVWIQGLVLVQSLMALIFHMCKLMVAGECYLTIDLTELSQILNCKVLYSLFTWLFSHNSTFFLFFYLQVNRSQGSCFRMWPKLWMWTWLCKPDISTRHQASSWGVIYIHFLRIAILFSTLSSWFSSLFL